MKILLIFFLLFSLVAPAFAQQEQNEIPSVSNIKTTSPLPGIVEVTWRTSFATTGCVKYGLVTIEEEQVCNQSNFTTGDHFIRLEDLLPGAKYLFRIVAVNSFGNEFETVTLSFHVRKETITIGSVLLLPETNSATVTFTTDYPCISRVEYQEKPLAGFHSVEGLLPEEEHEYHIVGLVHNTKYRYRLRCVVEDDISGFFPETEDHWAEFTTAIDLDAPAPPPPTEEEILEEKEQTLHDKRIEVIKRERIYSINIDEEFTRQQAGRILLQVEEKGEAWYVSPSLKKRIYLANGDDAQSLLHEEGEGITNKDLAKIPVDISTHIPDFDTDGDGLSDRIELALGTNQNLADTDGDGYNDKTELLNGFNPNGTGKLATDLAYAKSLGGQIFLQVETNGEAWYIHPDTGLRYYLGTSTDAYQVMRSLSLGITNKNLRKIDVVQ